jgi:L-threonylcarbamoyladenylate synthase
MLRVITTPTTNIDSAVIDQIVDVLSHGGVVAHPTETVYGLAANMFNEDAVRKIYNLKCREENKILSVMVQDATYIEDIVGKLSLFARNIIDQVFPGPITVIVPVKKQISIKYFKESTSIGFRIPDFELCTKMLNKLDFPITTTSANKSGLNDAQLAMEVMTYFGDSIDLLVDGGRTQMGKPSTVIDITDDQIKVLREGTFDISEIIL